MDILNRLVDEVQNIDNLDWEAPDNDLSLAVIIDTLESSTGTAEYSLSEAQSSAEGAEQSAREARDAAANAIDHAETAQGELSEAESELELVKSAVEGLAAKLKSFEKVQRQWVEAPANDPLRNLGAVIMAVVGSAAVWKLDHERRRIEETRKLAILKANMDCDWDTKRVQLSFRPIEQ